MARPQPTIICEITDGKCLTQVLQAEIVYAVCFNGKPIGIRRQRAPDYFRYMRSSFTNPGHAFNLAERLNSQLATDKFAVYVLAAGSPAVEISRSAIRRRWRGRTEERTKQTRETRNAAQRKYINKRLENPEFRKQMNAKNLARNNAKYHNDPEFRKRQRAYSKERYCRLHPTIIRKTKSPDDE